MKKLKRALSLLMMSAILFLPTAIPVQAGEVTNNTYNNVANVTPKSDNKYTTPALVTDANVPMKETAGLSGKDLMLLQKGYLVQLDLTNAVEVDGVKWYPCKYAYVYGFIEAQYVHIIATA